MGSWSETSLGPRAPSAEEFARLPKKSGPQSPSVSGRRSDRLRLPRQVVLLAFPRAWTFRIHMCVRVCPSLGVVELDEGEINSTACFLSGTSRFQFT